MNFQSYQLDATLGKLSNYDIQSTSRLSNLAGYFADKTAVQNTIATADPILYRVYGTTRPALAGDLISGITLLNAGQVGQEYYMTKGHFHAVLDTGEVYYALRGSGMMVLESPEGECQAVDFAAGTVLHIPPRWAHRTVNVGSSELCFFWVCPANAGHDYATIIEQGFGKLIVNQDGIPTVIDNPHR